MPPSQRCRKFETEISVLRQGAIPRQGINKLSLLIEFFVLAMDRVKPPKRIGNRPGPGSFLVQLQRACERKNLRIEIRRGAVVIPEEVLLQANAGRPAKSRIWNQSGVEPTIPSDAPDAIGFRQQDIVRIKEGLRGGDTESWRRCLFANEFDVADVLVLRNRPSELVRAARRHFARPEAFERLLRSFLRSE